MLTITVGPPGSGKSTWADANMTPTTLRLERDRMRVALFGTRRAYHEHPMPREARSLVVTEAMIGAMANWPHDDIILSDTGLELSAVDPFIALAKNYEIGVQIRLFVVPSEVLHERNRTRPEEQRIDPALLDEMIAKQFVDKPWWQELDLPMQIVMTHLGESKL
jgi:predicted kinase